MPDKDNTLFDQSTLRQLDRLMLIASRAHPGLMKGERRSTRRGTSIEFADYREYTPGDDLRRIDWNVYARLDRPFIKVLEEEEDLAVHILIDSSASMDWPRPSTNDIADKNIADHKLTCASRIAAGLGYMTLGSGDWLTVTTLTGSVTNQPSDQAADLQRNTQWGAHRGRQWTLDLLRYLNQVSASGWLDLNEAIIGYAMRAKRVGLLILISDLLSPSGYETGLNALVGRGYEVAILHTLAPDELDPPLAGDLRLIDIETGQVQEVTIDAALRDRYLHRLDTWQMEIKQFCSHRGIHYVQVNTTQSWITPILNDLRRAGVVQ